MTSKSVSTMRPSPASSGKNHRKRPGHLLVALSYLAPSLLVFAVFVFFPLAFSGYLSLTKWDMISPNRQFTALGNYRRLLDDPLFWKVLKNTTIFSVTVVLASMAIGLALAIILDRNLRGRAFYRAGIFLPYVTSAAAMALVWLWILDPQYGLINELLRMVGIKGPGWLASVKWALPAIIIMTVWRFVGYDMLIFLGGLQSISSDVTEAARIDGAGEWALFRHITLPLLSPTTFFITVTSFITMFQNFETVFVMTQGGPVNSTNMLVLYLYQNAFQYFEAGYASAIAVVLFLIVVGLTSLQLSLSRRWVVYG
ncbi:MAG: sugar ABC transporter permease [Chloroflexota bacterium]|nr:sugar ABC transporter permease [Chloroflexota bacterium]